MRCKALPQIAYRPLGGANKDISSRKMPRPLKVHPNDTACYQNVLSSTIRSVPTVPRANALIGRDREVAVIAGLGKEVMRGRGSVLLIEGEPGIGKSALVRAALTDASARLCLVLGYR